MTRAELALLLDHSVLKPEVTERDIRAGADLVRALRIGFYCVQPYWVKLATDAIGADSARLGHLIFVDQKILAQRRQCTCMPCGGEIVRRALEIFAIGEHGQACGTAGLVSPRDQGVPVKVIIEAAALSASEKELACRLACDAGAAFVKSSTGFHPSGGANVADVRLMRAIVGPSVGVKASGGIRNHADVRAMLDAGANRIGTSASAAIIGQWES